MDDHVTKTIALYDNMAQKFAKLVQRMGLLPERKRFAGLIPARGAILDAGCGSGRDSHYFESQGFNVTGIDLSSKPLEIAKKQAPRSVFIQQDLRNLSFAPNTFNGIWACASLLHLRHKEVLPVLSTMYQLLKPDGIIFISVKVGSGEHEKIEPSIPDAARFFSYYSQKQLKEVVRSSGFSIVDIYTFDEGERFSDRHGQWWISCFAKKI